jgi:hypothetical protein
MSQAFNLSQFANKVNTSGQADLTTAVTGTLPKGNGGTGLTTPGTSGNVLMSDGTDWVSGTIYPVRNRIINGAMTFDQRRSGASATANDNIYGVDRWVLYASQSSKLTCQQNQNSITPPAGYTNYLGYTSSSAYTVGASEYFSLTQAIEGFNIADLAWGTANAKAVTVSFWVRSSLTGTFGGALRNADVTRTYPFNYTISAANTWEYKTITIAGETSGTWNTTNGYGLAININLGAGSAVSGTAGAWASAFYCNASSTVNLVGTNGATFYITGVQLEQGSTATPFERRLYNQELANCQRYYEVATIPTSTSLLVSFSSGYNAAQYQFWQLKQTKRASPTVSIVASVGGGITTFPGVDVIQLYNASAGFYISGGGAGTVGITASAEL